ncbi:MAG: FAD binding domain-containing protein [Planctomycetia bacterium]|nr:FAD binding domain-containing protein [Planctomycetia bacterium]
MKNFEYAVPRTEAEALGLLSREWGETEILAGGTDLVGLMKKMIVTPDRVVNIKEIPTLRGVSETADGILIGAVTPLDEVLDSPLLDDFPAVKQAIRGISSIQLQAQGTIGGELCQRPQCWYYRNGGGLLADRGKLVASGDNRYHAIFNNSGPAKFVHPSRLAPALIALGAAVRVIGPKQDQESLVPLAEFYRVPRDDNQRETVLAPSQLVTHVYVPWLNLHSATYEVRHGEGPDYPLAAAAAALEISGGVVREARIVLGHVAPTPLVSGDARNALVGRSVDANTAESAGAAAVAHATPLSHNGYKAQLAKTAVKRAILLAAGLETGGF